MWFLFTVRALHSQATDSNMKITLLLNVTADGIISVVVYACTVTLEEVVTIFSTGNSPRKLNITIEGGDLFDYQAIIDQFIDQIQSFVVEMLQKEITIIVDTVCSALFSYIPVQIPITDTGRTYGWACYNML